MFSTDQVIELIKAHKSGDEELFNKEIQKLVKDSEARGKKGVAKALRDIYVKPSELFRRTSTASVSTAPNAGYSIDSLSEVTLDDVILSNRNQSNAEEILTTWRNRRKLKGVGVSHSTKLLLYGQPGTGKTHLANALAGTLGIPISYVDVSKLISSYLGETGKNIQALFTGRHEQVLFLDEFESLAKSRADDMDIGEAKRIVTAILQNLDSLSEDVLLVAATNHIEMVDSAIRRRFTHELNLDDIDLESRKQLFNLYLKHHKVPENRLLGFAKLAHGFTGHDVQLLYTKAIRRTVLELDNLSFESQLLRQIVETKYRKIDFNSKDEASVEELRSIVTLLRKTDKKYFTFEALENITGIPHSTINYIMKKGVTS